MDTDRKYDHGIMQYILKARCMKSCFFSPLQTLVSFLSQNVHFPMILLFHNATFHQKNLCRSKQKVEPIMWLAEWGDIFINNSQHLCWVLQDPTAALCTEDSALSFRPQLCHFIHIYCVSSSVSLKPLDLLVHVSVIKSCSSLSHNSSLAIN